MTIPDERLKEWIEACNTERGILENTTVMQIGEALSELLLLREQKRKLVEDAERLAKIFRHIESFVFSHNDDMSEVGETGYLIRVSDDVVNTLLDQHNALMKEIE